MKSGGCLVIRNPLLVRRRQRKGVDRFFVPRYVGFCKAVSLCFLSVAFMVSCNRTDVSRHEGHRFDSLLVVFNDSLGVNADFSYEILKEAQQYVSDSVQYYKLKGDFSKYYARTGKPDSALYLARQVITFGERNTAFFRCDTLMAMTHNTIGLCYSKLGEPDSVLSHFQRTLFYLDKAGIGDRLPVMYHNIGDMYLQKNDFVNSIDFCRKGLMASDSLRTNDEALEYSLYLLLARAYMGLRNFEESGNYFQKAGQLLEERIPSDQFYFFNARGNYYFYKEEYADALPCLLKARHLTKRFKDEYLTHLCLANLGDIYLHLNRLDSAQFYLEESYRYFQSVEGSNIVLYYLATALANLALSEGDEYSAKQLLDKHDEGVYIEPEILLLRYKALQDYFYRTGNYRQALEYQTKHVRLNDSIRSERVRNTIAEIDMRYRQDTTLMRKEFLIAAKDTELRKMKTINLLSVSLVLSGVLVTAIGYLFLRRKRELEEAKHVETVSRIRLQNIRNRISPHFMFNVLNRQVSGGEDGNRNSEMEELAKLLRKSLEFTEHIAIPLDDEIDFVKSYLRLEKSILGEDFSVVWNVEGSVDTSQWKIPAMLLQIPVENAVKHGLRPKIGEKCLEIHIRQTVDELLVDIKDNGKGYNPHEQSAYAGTGTGLNVLYRTIQLLNRKNEHPLEFNLFGLNDGRTGISGTMASIRMPAGYVY